MRIFKLTPCDMISDLSSTCPPDQKLITSNYQNKMLIWCALVVLLSINSSSSLNIPQSPPESRHYRLTTSLSSTSSGALLDEGQFFYLPIFPFRKSVTVPTGQVNLNLFEPRYLSLFNDVLSACELFARIENKQAKKGRLVAPSTYPPPSFRTPQQM